MATCPTCGRRLLGGAYCPEDGSRLTDDPPDPTGSDGGTPLTIDRYQVVRKIGEGGMSEVFEAEHIHLGRKVALKLLRRELTRDESAVERFRREARTTSALGHPNVVHVVDFGRAADGGLYLAMEWLHGETLAARLSRGEVAQDLALEIVEQLCDGLAAAHAAGVVHRDMKPANVFLARDRGGHEVAKILDFGIAKLALTDSSLTRTGTFVGTPDYIAPEQALGEEVDGRADVYAVGVMLYELLTGTVPFSGDNLMAVVHAHTIRRPDPPSQRAPERGIWRELEAIVMRCLEKEPNRRFASIAALGAAIHRARGGSDESFYDRLRAAGTDPARLAPAAETGEITQRGPKVTDGGRVAGRGPAVSGEIRPRVAGAGLAFGDELDEPLDLAPRADRGRWAAIVLILAAALAAGGLAIWSAGRPSVAATSADGSRDAGATLTLAADAAPARDAAPPPPDPGWKLLARRGGLEVTAWIRPRVIEPGATFALELELVPNARLRRSFRAPLELSLRFGDAQDPNEVRRRARLGADGRVALELALPRPGTFHVEVDVRRSGRSIARAGFDLCVGADPAGSPAELAARCRR